jgi:hypothetical protein
MSAAATHGDAGTPKLLAHRGLGNAQLGTDIAQVPTLCVQVGCTAGHGVVREYQCGDQSQIQPDRAAPSDRRPLTTRNRRRGRDTLGGAGCGSALSAFAAWGVTLHSQWFLFVSALCLRT